MKLISNEIGEDFKKWNRGDIIYITSPTGSGKTSFIVDNLLEYAVLNNKRILYLVNREILKEQLKERLQEAQCKLVLKYHGIDVFRHICLVTYQYLENGAMPLYYDYIIADECHYFYSDSLFNPKTINSFNKLFSPEAGCKIFISATMNRLKGFIENKIRVSIDLCLKQGKPYPKYHIREYSFSATHEHVNLICVNDKEELENILYDGRKEKTLVFIDSKEDGKKLYKNLKERKCDVVYFDADREDGSLGDIAANNIVKTQKIDNNICIVTSVLDNGVTISDRFLKRLVIMADTCEEFYQMLGRKRLADNEAIDVYVMKKSQNEFEQRKRTYIERYLSVINRIGINSYLECDKVLSDCMANPYYYEVIRSVCYVDYDVNMNKSYVRVNPFSFEQLLYLSKCYSNIINAFKEGDEFAFLREQAQWLKINDVESIISDCKVRTETKNYSVVASELEELFKISVANKDYVDEMKDYFLKNEKISEEVIKDFNETLTQRAPELLYDGFEMAQKKYSQGLRYLLEQEKLDLETKYWNGVIQALKKHRLTDEKKFNDIMKKLSIPYCLQVVNLGSRQKGGFSVYEIVKLENNSTLNKDVKD